MWFQDGKHHRLDGPAVIEKETIYGHPVDEERWYLEDQLHRIDGPAIVRADGSSEWYLDGKRHRDNGPAIVHANGTKEEWKNGKFVRYLNGPIFLKRPAIPFQVTENGITEWKVLGSDGKLILHRVDGPAVEHPNGAKEWYFNGEIHREGGPAMEFPVTANRRNSFYIRGRFIRDEKSDDEFGRTIRANHYPPYPFIPVFSSLTYPQHPDDVKPTGKADTLLDLINTCKVSDDKKEELKKKIHEIVDLLVD
jgi:hypothetical protein